MWTGWLAGGFTVAGVVIGTIAELTVLDTSENLSDLSLWEHVALLGLFAFIHWIIYYYDHGRPVSRSTGIGFVSRLCGLDFSSGADQAQWGFGGTVLSNARLSRFAL